MCLTLIIPLLAGIRVFSASLVLNMVPGEQPHRGARLSLGSLLRSGNAGLEEVLMREQEAG